MHAGTMQAFVVVFPVDLPVALNGLEQHVPDDELLERPGIETIDRQIEELLERRRIIGQRNEDEAVPLPHPDLVERKVAHLEAVGMALGGGSKQVSLQGV